MRSLRKAVLAGSAILTALAFQFTAHAAQQQDLPAWYNIVKEAPESAWRTIDQDDLIYMQLPSGTILIELRPDFAPNHVERIKTLTRQGFYDGTIFHRVIDGFMAQGGDPTGTGTGGSSLPDLQGEFMRARSEVHDLNIVGRDRRTSDIGFIGPIPVGEQPETLTDFLVNDGIAVWGMHCRGVMSMARASDPNSANSQFFLMFGDSRRSLDQRYTVWGRAVDGLENIRRINRGEPPERPTPINRMRVGSDVPADEQLQVQVLRTDTDLFTDYLKAGGYMSEDGFIDDVCSILIPTKIDGEIQF